MNDYSIRQILNKVSDGNLRIPAFQRGFVWDADSVAFLMDSIYKGYPFGTIQLWRTREKLQIEKKFGPFKLFEQDAQYPVDYVLDGQQRVTSIFGVFQTEIESEENEENPFKIYFNFDAEENSQDSQFVALEDDEVDDEKHFPLNSLFDSVKYREATEKLESSRQMKMDRLQETFKEAKIPSQTLETDDKSKVAIVFERINRKGVPLDTFQLLTAWTWSEDFDLQDRFSELQGELKPYGFEELGENADLLLRITSGVLTNNSNSKTLIELNGDTVKDKFEEVTNGIKGAIDFLKRNLKVQKLSNLPYEQVLIPLSAFFSISGNRQFRLRDNQRKIIISWLWKVFYSRRYSAGTNKKISRDIEEIIQLRDDSGNSNLNDISLNISEKFFLEAKFNMRSINTKSLILLLAQNNPKSFISGNSITLSEVLKDYNRNEFHHIYPKSYLKYTVEDSIIYSDSCLANFCFLSKTDNNEISSEKPSDYREGKMPEDSNEILESSFISEDLLVSNNFNEFVENRASNLYDFLTNKLI